MKLWHELWGNLGKSILSKGSDVGGCLAYSRNSRKTSVTSTAQERETDRGKCSCGGEGGGQPRVVQVSSKETPESLGVAGERE